MKALKLEVIFGARNKLSPALKLILGSSNAASKALKKTRDEIKALNDQQKRLDGFIKQKKAVEDSAKALKDMQNNIKTLRQSMGQNPTAEMTKEFDKAVAKARRLNQTYQQQRQELQRMRADMNQAGMSTDRLSEHQRTLRERMNQANRQMQEQQDRLRRLSQLQQNYQRQSGNLRNAGMYGAGAAATGVTAMYQLRKPINETKHVDLEENRIAALGLGKKDTADAIKFAKKMDTYGTSVLDNLSLMRDGITAFADVHHAEMVAPTLAKMKFSNTTMYGEQEGAENERKFMDMLKVIELRNGLKSEDAFNKQANIIQQVITATGGRVQSNEWLNAIKTGGIAVKGLSDEALYYKMEPIVQELGGNRYGTAAMSAYQNIYQGRTTKRAANNMERLGLIADPSKLKHDKAGQISFLDVGAIKGSELFKKDQFAWMEQVLLPELAKKGITERGQIHDAIGSIFTNRTASSLFSTMYDQREQIHKNSKLNAGADNIDQLNSKAKGTTAGKEIEAKANLHDAYLSFGTTILPIYTKAIETATNALQGFNGWMERNPTLAKMLGVGLLGIATSLVVIGGALAVFSPLILGMLSLRLIMASTSTAAGLFSRVFATAPMVLNVLKSALMGVGRVILFLGRALLMNPIGLLITAIAVAAYLIYKNWGPVSAFFSELWTNIKAIFAPIGAWFGGRITEAKTAFSGGIQGMSALIINWSPIGLFYAAFAKVMSWFGIDLPAKFTGFGGMIIDGLVNGIKSGFNKLKTIWAEVTSYIPTFFQKEQKIRSPSRVMAGLGGHIMGGLGLGLQQGFPKLKTKFADVLGIFSPNVSGLMQKINVAPALSKIKNTHALPSGSNRGNLVINGDTITMHIHAQPGQSAQQIAQMVNQMLNQRESQKLARVRNSFTDNE